MLDSKLFRASAPFISYFFLLALPLLVFLRNQGFPIFNSISLVSFMALGIIGILAGVLHFVFPKRARSLIPATFVVLFLDLQFNFLDKSIFLLLTVFVLLTFGFHKLRYDIFPYLAITLPVLFAASFLSETGAPVSQTRSQMQANESLPLLIHIILDEHIGPGGIPPEFPRSADIRKTLERDYKNNSFAVFSNAFSTYYDTAESISNTLNFTKSDVQDFYFGRKFVEGDFLEANKWFDILAEWGYTIEVFQSDYLDFTRPSNQKTAESISATYTYYSEALIGLIDTDIPFSWKIILTLGSFSKLSSLAQKTTTFINARASSGNPVINLLTPIGNFGLARVSPLISMIAFRAVLDRVSEAGPGQAIFAHILLPHYPYAYDETCTPIDDPLPWLEAKDISLHPARNDTESRALRYPSYLAQLSCIHSMLMETIQGLERNPNGVQPIVIIHGDHGSRICEAPASAETIDSFTKTDFKDAFSTLFVIKSASATPGIHLKPTSIQDILSKVVGDSLDALPGSAPFVLVRGKNGSYAEVSLPPEVFE